jgi:peptide/nickel transport system substrate-binding protein
MTVSPTRPVTSLRLAGPAVPQLDPAAAWQPPERQLHRLFTRQLVGYRAEPDPRDWRAVAPVADLATDIPSTYNAGLGASHRVYVVHLRPGVCWDTPVPRAVTAHDVVRGFKRLAAPMIRQPALPYFRSTIRGMDRYCAAYADAAGSAPADARLLAGFQNTQHIAGVYAVDDETVVFELDRPALDFIDLLGLTCTAPAPVEYDAFVPGSPEIQRALRSTGPYRVESIDADGRIRFEANPAWQPGTDPVRGRRVDRVETTAVPAGPAAARLVGAGDADLVLGASAAGLPAYRLDPYLVFNVRTTDPAVRRAVTAAIDRARIVDIVRAHEPGVQARVATSIVPPGNDAHQEIAAPATDPVAVPQGVTLRFAHEDSPEDLAVARSCAADLEAAGIAVSLIALGPGRHRDLLLGVGSPGWDVATARRHPDWAFGNARTFLQPMAAPGPGNHGGYHDAETDRLIRLALDAADPREVTAFWQQAERKMLADAAVVPLVFRRAGPVRHGDRVRQAVPLAALGSTVDLCDVRVEAGE